MSEQLPPQDEYEQLDLLEDVLSWEEWFASLPPTPAPTMDEELGRGAAFWARWRRQREKEGWAAP